MKTIINMRITIKKDINIIMRHKIISFSIKNKIMKQTINTSSMINDNNTMNEKNKMIKSITIIIKWNNLGIILI